MQLRVTPKFRARVIIDKTIRKDWLTFQFRAFSFGQQLHKYMQTYINSNHKRRGGTGKLSRSVNFEKSTGMGRIFWGIGNIALLPAYYYVINYGKMITGAPFIPNHGKFVPGSFEGSKPDSALRGGVDRFNYKDGSGFGMKPGTPIRPMHYIEATRARLNARLRYLILSLKRGK